MEALQWIKESEEKYPDSIGYSFFDPNHSRPMEVDIKRLYELGSSGVYFYIDFHADEVFPSSGDRMFIECPDDDKAKRQILDEVISWNLSSIEINDVPITTIEEDMSKFYSKWVTGHATMRVWFD